jgi:hypothetical protein
MNVPSSGLKRIKRQIRRALLHARLPKGPVEEFYSGASLMHPQWSVPSAWYEHAPFAFWLVATQRPRTVVELGAHAGFSYLCFCQMIESLGYDARAYAVDTWQGDDHAGFYGADILRNLRAYHDPRYGGFSTLIQATFDEALLRFADGTIDLLHIDGRHYYDDVKHDFEAWQPKLSPRAIVLFHDTQVRERDFGVHRFWSEIAALRPNFEFRHCHGLGVLGYGIPDDPKIADLLALPQDGATATSVRELYRRLGKVC